jgi:nucleoid-associated protein YgaU
MEANTCSSGPERLRQAPARVPSGPERVRWDRVALLAALLVGSAGAVGRAAAGATDGRTERYVVQSGDTLWDIARARVGPEGDPRTMVADIREANGLGTAVLRSGEVLRLPVP